MSENRESDEKDEQEQQAEGLVDVVEETQDEVQGEGNVTVGELLDSIENRGFGPLLLVPALVSLSPLGGIPGISIVTGSVIILIAVQMLFFSGHPWIPKRLEEFEFSKEKYDDGVKKSKPWLKWVDRFIHKRWPFLTTGVMHYVLAVLMICISLTYFPLAFVPLGVALPGLANSIIAVGITARDGVFVLIGMFASLGAFWGLFYFWPF